MFDYACVRTDDLITGYRSGQPVSITPQSKSTWDELVRLANGGACWAQIAVRAVEQLIAGRLSQNNIFIKSSSIDHNGVKEFLMILPGCRVTVEKLPNGCHKLVHLQADLNFGALIEQRQAPGLYEVKRQGEEWKIRPRENELIKKRPDRVVVVSDGGYKNLEVAALTAVRFLMRGGPVASVSRGSRSLRSTAGYGGFDFHYTPGFKRIGKLLNYRQAVRPLDDESLHESALLLARRIYMARNLHSVRWISDFGGSGILTQALRILADQKVELDGHAAFMVRPTTSPYEAITAIHAVPGLEVQRKFKDSHPMDIIGNMNRLKVIRERRKHEGENWFRK